MRLIHSGIGFTIALCAFNSIDLTTVATQLPDRLVSQAPSSSLAIQGTKDPASTSTQTVIEGNGVKFAVPAGFKGGVPDGAEIKEFITEAAKMMPSLGSMIQSIGSNPEFFRAIAININPQGDTDLFLVNHLPIPANVTLEEIREAMSKAIPSMLPPEFKLVSSKVTNVGSRQIVQLTVDVNIQGMKMKESIGLFKQGDEIFQVTHVYLHKNSQRSASIFEQVINTFQVTPKANTTGNSN
jgi:hypothetical protein